MSSDHSSIPGIQSLLRKAHHLISPTAMDNLTLTLPISQRQATISVATSTLWQMITYKPISSFRGKRLTIASQERGSNSDNGNSMTKRIYHITEPSSRRAISATFKPEVAIITRDQSPIPGFCILIVGPRRGSTRSCQKTSSHATAGSHRVSIRRVMQLCTHASCPGSIRYRARVHASKGSRSSVKSP